MPNWCDNVERIVGPKKQVKALCDNLNKWIHTDIKPERPSDKWLGNIVYHSGLAADKNPGNWGYACRGELVDGFYYVENGDEGIIQFNTMTAWGPYPETWYALLKKCAPDTKYYYMAFEPNMCIYESNDAQHQFFHDEFVISVSLCEKDKLPEKYVNTFLGVEDGFHWDWDPDEVIEMMEDFTGIRVVDRHNDDEVKLLMDAFDTKMMKDLEDTDNYINVYRINYYDPEKVEDHG